MSDPECWTDVVFNADDKTYRATALLAKDGSLSVSVSHVGPGLPGGVIAYREHPPWAEYLRSDE